MIRSRRGLAKHHRTDRTVDHHVRELSLSLFVSCARDRSERMRTYSIVFLSLLCALSWLQLQKNGDGEARSEKWKPDDTVMENDRDKDAIMAVFLFCDLRTADTSLSFSPPRPVVCLMCALKEIIAASGGTVRGHRRS